MNKDDSAHAAHGPVTFMVGISTDGETFRCKIDCPHCGISLFEIATAHVAMVHATLGGVMRENGIEEIPAPTPETIQLTSQADVDRYFNLSPPSKRDDH